MIRTVFPTPAPPNSPIFPPFEYGARRSMTFIPVSRASTVDSCSSKAGADLWIGQRSLVFTGPISSTGSPMTFIILPRASLPTGMVICWPVSTACIPRTSPSVESMAMHLTVFSPKCWATSRTRFPSLSSMEGLVSLTALNIGGSFPLSNSTSTTGPITWVTFPVLI